MPDKDWEEIERDSLYLTEIEYAYDIWKKKRRMIIKKSPFPNLDYEREEKDIFGRPVPQCSKASSQLKRG